MRTNPDKFRAWLPLEGSSGGLVSKGSPRKATAVVIEGGASFDIVDLDGEVTVPSGLVWDRFLLHGELTDCHPYAKDRVVGFPLSVTPTVYNGSRSEYAGAKGFKLKAVLDLSKPRAVRIVSDHNRMIASGLDHGYGFSIEGDCLGRSADGKRLLGVLVTSVAIDKAPRVPIATWQVTGEYSGPMRDRLIVLPSVGASSAVRKGSSIITDGLFERNSRLTPGQIESIIKLGTRLNRRLDT